MTEVRVPMERVDEHGNVTGRGTARMRGVTRDDYRDLRDNPMKLRAGESWVLVVTMRVEETDAD